MAAIIEGDERVMAAAQQIVRSLGTSQNVTEDMILILSNFDNRLSTITELLSKGASAAGLSKNEERLEAAEKVVRRWDSVPDTPHRYSSPWEDSPDEAAEYISAIDEILRLTEDLTLKSNTEIMDRAESVLQLAMSRLEDDFRQILTRNTVPLDADRLYGSIRRVSLSFASNVGDIDDLESPIADVRRTFSDRCGSIGDDFCVDLVNPDAIADLQEIADRMIRSGYEKECHQVYSSVRRDVLEDCLSIIGIEKLGIEEVQKIEWRSLDEKMKKWIQAVKILIRVLLPGEKRLCEQVFGGSELIKEVCFTESAKGCVMQLMNFAEAITIGRKSPEKLFRILDMYEALAGALPELQVLFSDGSEDFVYSEARDILAALGETAKGTFEEFANAVQSEASRKPVQETGVHGEEGGDDNNLQLASMSPMGHRLLSVISSLELNLEEKSRFYDESAMQYVFLMNNILYIVQKVKDSELGKLLGDNWVRKRRGQIRQYSTSYLRASWSKVLSCLKDEGIGGGRSSSNVSKVALRERFKNFNMSFEEIYRIQTAWKVPDPQLAEELRISISEKQDVIGEGYSDDFYSQCECYKSMASFSFQNIGTLAIQSMLGCQGSVENWKL
ncbi:hypothetical protein NE237_008016 [Protea cynaroides]|uniref:Exocyst subunit Exo70 family protein n=1 Tax=Protea cynaroides TaxID=273540 RepID=A0A9Q0KQ94_9MAGN|nr:hypothetical protein NE237_008016 [Protea cynaroides]